MLFMVPTRTRFLTELSCRRENLAAPVSRRAVPRGVRFRFAVAGKPKVHRAAHQLTDRSILGGGNALEPSELGLGKQDLHLLHRYRLGMDACAVKCEESVGYTGNSATNASGESACTSAKGSKSEAFCVTI